MSPLSHAAFAKAGEEVRTPNVQLGRLELCQLSYTRAQVVSAQWLVVGAAWVAVPITSH